MPAIVLSIDIDNITQLTSRGLFLRGLAPSPVNKDANLSGYSAETAAPATNRYSDETSCRAIPDIRETGKAASFSGKCNIAAEKSEI